MKVPDVKRCCFCFPLRWGIVVFGVINTMLSILTMSRLVFVSEHHKASSTGHFFDLMTNTLFLILVGSGIILSILMLVGGYQKDPSLLRLYNCYAMVLVVIILIQTITLVCRAQYKEVGIALLITAMQIYLIVLVRSDIMKLESKQTSDDVSTQTTIEVPDRVTLL